MKVVLGEFARTALEVRSGGDVEAAVAVALRHFAWNRRLEPSPPSLLHHWLRASEPAPGTELELLLDRETEAALERAADSSGRLSLGGVGTHAVLVYLADLDRAGAEVSSTPARS